MCWGNGVCFDLNFQDRSKSEVAQIIYHILEISPQLCMAGLVVLLDCALQSEVKCDNPSF